MAPTITNVDPQYASVEGGIEITITGTGFAMEVGVRVDNKPATKIERVDATTIRATVPPRALPGRVAVMVTNDPGYFVSGPSATWADQLEYFCVIKKIEPTAVDTGGGTTLTLTGLGFPPGVTVSFGGNPAANVRRVSATTITCETLQHALGDVTLMALGPGGTEDFASEIQVTAPLINGVSPARGPIAVSTQVTIEGKRFAPGAVVRFDGVDALAVTFNSSTELVATAPAHAAGPIAVEVENPAYPPIAASVGSLANAFEHTGPEVTSIEPALGPIAGGTDVTIKGRGFLVLAANGVQIGGVAATQINRVDANTVTARTGAHAAGATDVSVQNNNGDPAAVLAGAFRYVAAPAVTGVRPAQGPGGTQITIDGDHFVAGATVRIDGQPATNVRVVSATAIQAVVPAHVDAATNVEVQNEGGAATTLVGGFTYDPALVAETTDLTNLVAATVIGISPATGTCNGGTAVTLTGTGFVDGATVTIDGDPATDVVVVSTTTITATTPDGAIGFLVDVDVAVTNPGAEEVIGADLFKYREPPTISAVANPAQGPLAGGRAITLTGADFVDGATAVIDGNPHTEVEFVDATHLRLRVPARATPGAVSIAVHNPGDPEPGPARANTFTYSADPNTASGDNSVELLLDGEEYFTRLQTLFGEVRQAPPDDAGLTYIRMAFWMYSEETTLGNRHCFGQANHLLFNYIEQVARAGHHVEVILWRPNAVEKQFSHGKGVYETNRVSADKLYEIDKSMAAVEGAGRVRVYFEHTEGELGSSLHQKIVICSIAGQRKVVLGGLNLSEHYFDVVNHRFPDPDDPWTWHAWHDAAVYLQGPVTDDVEKEWMRRWHRTRTLEAEWFGVANVVGRKGEFLARDFAFFKSTTVRQREIQSQENTTPQTPQVDNREVTIATTRSVGTTRHTHILDKLRERIRAANNYIYFENYHFCDPDLVQAIVARHAEQSAAGHNLRVVIIVPATMSADSSYLTRRAWLHMALTFNDAAGVPLCVGIRYDIGGGEVAVARAACGVNWHVTDCYDPNSPKATSWLQNDSLRLDDGSGEVEVAFHQILAVDVPFHFYCPKISLAIGGTGSDGSDVYTHGKVAAFDDWLVVGSANWSARSMQYDAEISAFINSNGVTAPAVARLLRHFNTHGAAPTPATIEARATHNTTNASPPPGHIALYPCDFLDITTPLAAPPNDHTPQEGNPRFRFAREVPPTPGLSDLRQLISNPGTPNYTWL